MASVFNPVFNQQTVISRAVSQPATDYQVPPVGSNLSLSGIKSGTALSENTGIDCKLIHGDRYEYIDGIQTTYIGSDCDETVNGNWSVQINGATNLFFIGVFNSTAISTTIKQEVGATYDSESDSGFKHSPHEWGAIGFKFDLEITVSLAGLGFAAVGEAKWATFEAGLGLLKKEKTFLKDEEHELKTEIEGLESKIGTLEGDVEALVFGAHPKVNAGPEVATAQIPPL